MDNMYSHDFDKLVNAASSLQRPARVALAGADVENILLGLFDAQEAGFAEPILIGNYQRIMDKLKALGLETDPLICSLLPTMSMSFNMQ